MAAIPRELIESELFGHERGAFTGALNRGVGRFEQAAIGVFCAMVLDSLDGRVARMTNTQSAFGEQMDSLADMVSFGAAPALIAYVWALTGLGRWGWIAAFVYCACAALRLARFNVNTAVVDKRFFQGLPSPAAAALVIGFIWLMTEAGVKGAEVPLPLRRSRARRRGPLLRGARSDDCSGQGGGRRGRRLLPRHARQVL
jgi:CDP-diacylglycerol--serine O-phosphatidyltransferase